MSFRMTDQEKQIMARETAKMVLEVEAVLFNVERPFIFTSGWASPVYMDCRKLISYPRIRKTLLDFAEITIQREVGYENIASVIGGETAGIPYAAWIADRLMLPMQYVRKKPKGFGRNAQIEGYLPEGCNVLLVEDLTTDARSKLNFAHAIRQANAVIHHAFSMFYYAIYSDAERNLRESDIELHYLATWWDVLNVAKAGGYYSPDVLREIEKFLNAPEEWSKARGGFTGTATQVA
jgi:orotate phosphoribosyltransferase